MLKQCPRGTPRMMTAEKTDKREHGERRHSDRHVGALAPSQLDFHAPKVLGLGIYCSGSYSKHARRLRLNTYSQIPCQESGHCAISKQDPEFASGNLFQSYKHACRDQSHSNHDSTVEGQQATVKWCSLPKHMTVPAIDDAMQLCTKTLGGGSRL
ncbi:hypothetical protein BKA93DRAFT_32254 [Sparassis latifolia]